MRRQVGEGSGHDVLIFKDQYVVISVNEGTGWSEATGPFTTHKEAYQWAEQNLSEDCSWHVRILYDPRGKEKE